MHQNLKIINGGGYNINSLNNEIINLENKFYIYEKERILSESNTIISKLFFCLQKENHKYRDLTWIRNYNSIDTEQYKLSDLDNYDIIE